MGTTVRSYQIDVEIDYSGVLEEMLRPAVDEVASGAPVRSGRYKGDITGTIKKERGNDILYIYVRPPQYRLAHILEFGTTGLRSQQAQPHFRPAFEQLQKVYENKMRNVDINVKQ